MLTFEFLFAILTFSHFVVMYAPLLLMFWQIKQEMPQRCSHVFMTRVC